MSFGSWFKSANVKGSAFAKVAEADVLAIEAKGRVIAIDAANKVKNDVADFLEKEAGRVHKETDKVKARFQAILSLL